MMRLDYKNAVPLIMVIGGQKCTVILVLCIDSRKSTLEGGIRISTYENIEFTK